MGLVSPQQHQQQGSYQGPHIITVTPQASLAAGEGSGTMVMAASLAASTG